MPRLSDRELQDQIDQLRDQYEQKDIGDRQNIAVDLERLLSIQESRDIMNRYKGEAL